MSRHYPNWLEAFLDYSKFGEAPKRMYTWSGLAALAGALRRKVWIDQIYFRWYANMYVVLVAPPGIVSKSTTASVAMNLLRQVPGVNFGPDVCTWPALITSFATNLEWFDIGPDRLSMSALTLESSEFGNLLNPQDREMIDLLVALWDGKTGKFEKKTKHSGNDSVENPWINLIACTTPSWIAGNFPEYLIGGGFTSRCVFVYADKKDNFVAYPALKAHDHIYEQREMLIDDLTHISINMAGEYKLSKKAIEWGEEWYEKHYTQRSVNMASDVFGGYNARKQTHIHKVAMLLAASESDELIIEADHLALADVLLTDLEPDLHMVFDKIGKSPVAVNAERLVSIVRTHGSIKLVDAYKMLHSVFPSHKEFEDVMRGCLKAGYFKIYEAPDGLVLTSTDSILQLD